jgi:hypothetical protein
VTAERAWVRYRVTGAEDQVLDLEFQNACFSLAVRDRLATFTFHTSPHNASEALGLAGEFLRSWVGDELLQPADRERRNFWLDAYSVGSDRLEAFLQARLETAPAAGLATEQQWRPWRHHDHRADPLLSGLISRYEDCRSGRERPTVMGFFCLTALEQVFGDGPRSTGESKRAKTAAALGMPMDLLDRLGDLTSDVGSFRTGRKGRPDLDATELSADEALWIENAVRRLIRAAAAARS